MIADFDRVTLAEVSRSFGRRRALWRVTLECRAGEATGVLGPNGSGKSTLLAILATLLTPTAGEVRYGAHAGGRAGGALRARIGLLAHDPQLYPELSARENLVFFARLYGLPDAPALAAAAVERAGLADRADDAVGTFSRGMRQRLALERALLHHPRLLLLDEPFTGLDDEAADALVGRLCDLKKSAIVVLATHDLALAERLLDCAYVLREGRLAGLDGGGESLRAGYRRALSATRAER